MSLSQVGWRRVRGHRAAFSRRAHGHVPRGQLCRRVWPVEPPWPGRGRQQRAASPAPCCLASCYRHWCRRGCVVAAVTSTHCCLMSQRYRCHRVIVASALIRCTSTLLPALCVSPLPRARGRAAVTMPFMALRRAGHDGRTRAHVVRSAGASRQGVDKPSPPVAPSLSFSLFSLRFRRRHVASW